MEEKSDLLTTVRGGRLFTKFEAPGEGRSKRSVPLRYRSLQDAILFIVNEISDPPTNFPLYAILGLYITHAILGFFVQGLLPLYIHYVLCLKISYKQYQYL